ncbi:GNAT family N-acetyltransferase [Streptomyces pinistramenti]|uniref:GNAT family N-acetyltransferase n=1 Tax=Streptomyces pinistramenti TaxID=2884812 RepID=UPI001D0989F1|nr:GNAT family N-acetyltransferase [Streptomyces pinistramenti]MCB5909067.1 GNAT family N-acetyltransferase [Streptomyces pinistramenti]
MDAVRERAPQCVRELTEDDIDAVAALRVNGWRAAYTGLMPQPYLDSMSAAEYAERHRARFRRRPPGVSELVAERAGQVIGWAAVGPARDPDLAAPGGGAPVAGELLALYVAPALIGTGVGRTLLAAAEERARAAGFGLLCLWVVRGNARARRFYERAGFTPDGAEEASDAGGVSVPELRYRRPVVAP